jgi:hypothetical protein
VIGGAGSVAFFAFGLFASALAENLAENIPLMLAGLESPIILHAGSEIVNRSPNHYFQATETEFLRHRQCDPLRGKMDHASALNIENERNEGSQYREMSYPIFFSFTAIRHNQADGHLHCLVRLTLDARWTMACSRHMLPDVAE